MLRADTNRTLDVLLGERLRALRQQGNHSVMKMALTAECSPTVYASVERGQVRIRAEQLIMLSQVLGVPVSVFYVGLLD